jgi:hypothetical protein
VIGGKCPEPEPEQGPQCAANLMDLRPDRGKLDNRQAHQFRWALAPLAIGVPGSLVLAEA